MASADVTSPVSAELRFGNPSDEQLLQTFRPPAYCPPYPVNISPHYVTEVFKEKTRKWLQHHSVEKIFSPKVYQMLIDMEISGLAARIFTKAPEWALEWASKFFFMLWIFDDVIDCTEMGQSPEAALSPLLELHLIMMWSFPDDPLLRNRLPPFLHHLDDKAREEKMRYVESMLSEARTEPGTVYAKPTTNIISNIYLELWTDVVTNCSSEFCLRLAHSCQRWFMGILKETEHRKCNTIPSSIETYIELRKETSAMSPTIVIADFVYGLDTPDNWFCCPAMTCIVEGVIDIISWHNDLWSFKREVLVGKDKFNIVLIISVIHKVSYKEAADITTQMIYDKIAALEQAAKELEVATPPEYQQSFDLYMLTARNWVSGTHDWHSKSVRYK